MAEAVVLFSESDVCGAILPEKVVEKNSIDTLRRWINCRGLSTPKSESHSLLVRRVNEMVSSGLHKFVVDPDKNTTILILQDYVKTLKVDLPDIDKWQECLDAIPAKYSYSTIVEYLIKRHVAFLDPYGKSLTTPMELPTADKPLIKGHNFFASGHVGEILINFARDVVHIRTDVLASMREIKYDVKCVLDSKTGLVILASCKCPAGAAGKCNHVAALLFALLDYVTTMRNPDCCTYKPQVWHRPQRKAKRATKPLVVGNRQVKKNVYGRTVTRKRPLEDYNDYHVIQEVKLPDHGSLLADIKQLQTTSHTMGLFQVLDSSTDTASSDEGDSEELENLSPEEVVLKRLQVTQDERAYIEQQTVGQQNNTEWYKQRACRLTASKAKQYCGKGNPVPLLKAILSEDSVRRPIVSKHMTYGIEHEAEAVAKYMEQCRKTNSLLTVRECGLFVDIDHGQLGASPDRIATCDGENIVLEVKCLSASRTLTPLLAVKLKQQESSFAFKMINNGMAIKDKHPWNYQVQMQMAITKIYKCHLIVFTSSQYDVHVCEISFDKNLWESMKVKLLDFHASYVVPAMVSKLYK